MLRFVGVLGWPLERTLSPVIHTAAFRALRLPWVYLLWPVPPEELETAVGGLRTLGASGANVTMPHKEAVIGSLDGMSGDARSVGAVNTIQRVGDKLIGHNTDVDGFRSWMLEDAGVSPDGERALVLGAGGASRAVVRVLDELGASGIVVASRSRARAEGLVESSEAKQAGAVDWSAAAGMASECTVIVNATPLGMKGEQALPGATFRPGQTVLDLVYEPPATPLVEAARAAGAGAWGGLGMLVHQGASSFRIWTGQDAPVEAMSAAALHALSRKR